MENESMFFNEALQENHSNIKEDIKEVEPEFKEQVLKIVGSERLISSPSFLREVHATNRECAERILSEGLKMTRRGGLSGVAVGLDGEQ